MRTRYRVEFDLECLQHPESWLEAHILDCLYDADETLLNFSIEEVSNERRTVSAKSAEQYTQTECA